MSETIEISLKELECLRRHLNEANEIFNRLGVGSDIPIAPKLTPAQQRELKYERMLNSGQRAKKPEHLKKTNPRK